MSPSRFFVKTTLPAPIEGNSRHVVSPWLHEGQSVDEVLLERDEHGDRRDRCHESTCRQQVVVGEELALEVVQGRCDRLMVAARGEDQRPQEVVVDEREFERCERRERRLAERQDDLEVLAQDARAVDRAASLSDFGIVFM